jgi:small subunit ribosomal protein S11
MTNDTVKTTAETTAAPKEGKDAVVAAKPTAVKGKKKAVRQVARGHAYIQASYNNTLVSIADPSGNVLAWASAGMAGFKGPKKATPYAASMVVKNVIDKVAPYGVKEVSVFVKGIGGGRESAIRALHNNGLNVVSVDDVTPIPHNGCRAPKKRRV